MRAATLTTGQVITLGDGRLACPIGEVYEALNSLLDDNLMTHQLPRAVRFVAPDIKVAFPWLMKLPPLGLEGLDDKARELQVRGWVDLISQRHGYQHQAPDLSKKWTRMDPLVEAAEAFGGDDD